MKRILLEEIDRDYTLAKDVLDDNFQVLLGKGNLLKKEYIDKLAEMGVREVCVETEKLVEEDPTVILKTEMEESFRQNIKNVMERHIYTNSSELQQLMGTAEDIISNVLEEKEVVEQVYDIKERSADIYEHSISLCTLATLTALKLGLLEEDIHDIAVSCLLHDLGLRYITIPYQNRDIRELEDYELKEYKKHPVYAYSALKNERWISEKSKNMILMHHEYIDGTGYPLHATSLPLEVCIVNVCDAFDEMICGVGCARAKVYEAIEFLKIFRGSRFNRKVVDTLLQFTAVYPTGTKVKLTTGELGVVVKQNREFPERPVLHVLVPKSGPAARVVFEYANIEYEEGRELNLLAENSVFISEVIE